MSSGDGIARSALEKPLHQLTEDDISQLTREDCRRYLKEKGMRRPSWNKSQAIQQVISLKSLLEPTPDPETAKVVSAPKKPCHAGPEIVNRVSKLTEKRGANEFQSIEESAAPTPSQCSARKDYTTHHMDQPAPGAASAAGPPRVVRDQILPVPQLTIFYGGKVNAYDDVSRDKARTLLQLAASPHNFLPDSPPDGAPGPKPYGSHLQSLAYKAGPNFLPSDLQPSHTEGASNRKACVQRYLEKRKDRFKRKVGMSSPTSLDVYLSQQMGDNVPSEQSGQSDIYCSSSSLSSLPHMPAKCSPAGNAVGDLNLYANKTDADEL